MRRRRNRLPWARWLVVLLPLFAIGFLCMRYEPMFRAYASNQVQYVATQAINAAITEELAKSCAEYQSLVSFEHDDENHVTALKTDAIALSTIKAKAVDSVYECINTLETKTIQIPLGSVIAPSYIGGKGPRLRVGMAGLGTAKAELISAFSSAGINQTRHNIVLEVTTEVGVLLPIGTEQVNVSSKFNLTDTVIVGTVPGQYTYIDDTEQSLLGKINDYTQP